MEKINVYAIYDRKGKRFDTPYFAHSDLFARRRYELMSKEGPLNEWPEDFELWSIGTFDVQKGNLTENIYLVGNAENVGESNARANVVVSGIKKGRNSKRK